MIVIKIGMFDSGLGGLTVLKEFVKKYPNNEYYYYGDTANIPYGIKTKEELLKLSSKIIKYLDSKKVDIIVIACGTVSSNIYDELKRVTKTPLINIIDSTVKYINSSNYKNILVLATSSTVMSHVFKKNVPLKNVKELECGDLVLAIENNEPIDNLIYNHLKNIDLSKTDAIVLGCTHFPIIKDKIKKYTKDIPIINMGKCLVNEMEVPISYQELNIKFSKDVSDEIINKILY